MRTTGATPSHEPSLPIPVPTRAGLVCYGFSTLPHTPKGKIMNDNAKLLTTALRSGQFPQGYGLLHNLKTNTYCVLGVACEVFCEHGGRLSRIQLDTIELYEGKEFTLPRCVQNWLGFASRDGCCGGTSLVKLNDAHMSFAYLADLIESKPEGLFIDS